MVANPIKLPPTWCQCQTLADIEDYTAAHGYPPTIRELAEAAGIRTNAVVDRLKALRRRSLVTWEMSKSRTIRVVAPAPAREHHCDSTHRPCIHEDARDCAQERDPYGDGRARDCMCECHGAIEGRVRASAEAAT